MSGLNVEERKVTFPAAKMFEIERTGSVLDQRYPICTRKIQITMS